MWLQRLTHAFAARWRRLVRWPGAAPQRAFSEPLEQRLPYSADPLGLAATLDGLTQDTAASHAEVLTANDVTPSSARPLTVLVAVDLRVHGADTLITDLEAAARERGEDLQLLLLNTRRGGLQQITDALQRHQGSVAAVHIVSHAQPVQLLLGASLVGAELLETESAALQAWAGALAPGADVLRWGCEAGAGTEGTALLQGLARWTLADVAASDDRSGHVSLGGDWALESSTGPIEAGAPFSAGWMAGWQHTLATFTVTNTANAGAGSLRQAILDANDSPGQDTIVFNIAGTGAHTISLTSPLPSFTSPVVLDATTDDSYAANGYRPAIVLDGSDLFGDGLNFDTGSDGSTVRGMLIRDFAGVGIVVGSAVEGVQLLGNWLGAMDTAGNALPGEANGYGVWLAGTQALVSGNVMAGNSSLGVALFGLGATENTVRANLIDVLPDGRTGLSNDEAGVGLWDGAASNLIGGVDPGDGNVIAYNAAGILMDANSDPADDNAILGNRIWGHAGLGINLGWGTGVSPNDPGDVDIGINDLQNYPVITSATVDAIGLTVVGTLVGEAVTTYRIELFSSRPDLINTSTGAVILDGRTQTTSFGDTNPLLLGTGGTVGRENIALAQVAAPDIELADAGGVGILLDIQAGAAGSEVRGLAILGSESIDLRILADDVHIEGNVFGIRANSLADPGAGQRSAINLVQIGDADNGTFRNNLLAYSGLNALDNNSRDATGWLIEANEIAHAALSNSHYDVLFFQGTNTTIRGNLLRDSASSGVDVTNSTGGIVFDNNTVRGLNGGEGHAVTMWGGATGVLYSNNVIRDNPGGGLVIDGGTSVLTRNLIVNNGGLADIDLGRDGIQSNDANDGDSGPNNRQNHPSLSSVTTNNAGSVAITGDLNSEPNRHDRLEFFATSTPDASGHGGAQRYLGHWDVMTDGSGDASFGTVLSAALAPGERVMATATESDASYTVFLATSELGPNTTTTVAGQGLITVTTAGDVSDGDTASLNALILDPGADGLISLREAITAANNTPNDVAGADRIRFSIAGTGTHLIGIMTALPEITDVVEIDATTDDSFAANGNRPAIVLDGNDISASGLVMGTGGGGLITGLVVRNFGQTGIDLQAGSVSTRVVGNYVGALGTDGEAASTTLQNGTTGIRVAGNNHTIGEAGNGNVVSGNGADGIFVLGDGHVVQGNRAGTSASGMVAVPNAEAGISIFNGSGNQIGGAAPGSGNLASGNTLDGIKIYGPAATNNLVIGNRVGLNADASAALPNQTQGVWVAQGAENNRVGGTTSAEANEIAGNNLGGVQLADSGTTGNRVEGNWIGRSSGGQVFANSSGVEVVQGAAGNVVGGTAAGAGNTITGNTFHGVVVRDNGSIDNAVLGNRISSNGAQGIALNNDGPTLNDTDDVDTGPNDVQNHPVLTLVQTGDDTRVVGSFQGEAARTLRIEFFSSPAQDAGGYGEGAVLVGDSTITTDGSGNASFDVTLTGVALTEGHVLTATATPWMTPGVPGGTSEFSLGVVIQSPNGAPVVTGPADLQTSEDTERIVPGVRVDDQDFGVGTVNLQVTQGRLTVDLTGGARLASGALGSGSLSLQGDLAQLNAALSSLRYTGNPDFNGQDHLSVMATDAAGLAATATVTVSVAAVNDAPVFSGDAGAPPWQLDAPENSPLAVSFSATDIDSPVQSLRVSIAGGADAALFELDTSSGQLRLIAPRDHESPADANRDNVYEVQLRVTDDLGAAAEQAFRLRVATVNEAPVLAVPERLELLPGARVRSVVGTAAGSDDDPAGLSQSKITTIRLRVVPGGGEGSLPGHGGLPGGLPSLPGVPPAPPAQAPAPSFGPPSPAPAPAPTSDPGPVLDTETAGSGSTSASTQAPVGSAPASTLGQSLGSSLGQSIGKLTASDVPGDGLRDEVLALLQGALREVTERLGSQGSAAQVDALLAASGTAGTVPLSAMLFGATPMELTRALLQEGLELRNDAAEGLSSMLGRVWEVGARDGSSGEGAADDILASPKTDGERTRAEVWLIEITQPEKIVGVSATAGLVWWVTRGGGVIASALMGVPAWRQVDLVPVMLAAEGGSDDDNGDDDRLAHNESTGANDVAAAQADAQAEELFARRAASAPAWH